jgi:hypothetical protein
MCAMWVHRARIHFALKGRGLALHGPGRTDDQRTISIGPINGTM